MEKVLKTQRSQIPAVVYAAKSTEDHRGSLQTQLADALAMAKKHGWLVVAQFSDEGFSAYKGNRGPGLERAKAAAKSAAATDGICMLVVQHSDRLARGAGNAPAAAQHLGEVYFWARRHNIHLRSVQDDANLEDALRAVLVGERNTEDSRRKAEAVKAGLRRSFERGHHGGGPVPDGYARIHRVERGRMASEVVDDPIRVPLIRRIFELADAGIADANIARRINAEGHRTQSDGRWTRRRVQDTLTNPFYTGQVVWHRGKPDEERTAGLHPAIVEFETFERIQAFRVARDRAVGSNRTPGRPNTRHVLAGLARCARCGTKMRPQVSSYKRKDGSRARSYLCRQAAEANGGCDGKPIDAEIVDAAFIQHLETFFVDFDGWLESVTNQQADERGSVETSLARDRKRRAKIHRRQSVLAERYGVLATDGRDVEAHACALSLERVREEASQIEHRLAELEAVLSVMNDKEAAPVDGMLDFYNRLADAVRGRLAREEVAEVNLGLKEVLELVELDVAQLSLGPAYSVLPVLKPESMALFGGDLQGLREFEERGRPFSEPALLEGGAVPIVPPLHRLTASDQKEPLAHE